MTRSRRNLIAVSAGVGIAATLPVMLPALFEWNYTSGDPTGCDLGSLGAAIGGFFLGALVLAVAVVGASLALQSARVLLVLPYAAACFFAVAELSVLPMTFIPNCEEPYSGLAVLVLGGTTGALTYLLTRGFRSDPT